MARTSGVRTVLDVVTVLKALLVTTLLEHVQLKLAALTVGLATLVNNVGKVNSYFFTIFF